MTKRVGIAVCAAACLAAFGAGAEERAAGDRLAVFPLEGVNVTGSVVNASGEVLSSALRGQEIDVAEWQEGYRALYGEPEPPPPPPPPPPGDPAAASDALPVVVASASPPPPPGTTPSAVGYGSQAAADPSTVALNAEQKTAIARQLGCSGYVDGKLVRLGTKIRVSINLRGLDGNVVDAWQTEAKTEDDLANALERIAMALAGDKTVEETLNLDNATMAEAQRQSNRFRIEKNLGVVIGHAFGFADSLNSFTLIAFDGRFEIKDALIEINGGFAMCDDIDFQFIIDIAAAYYLTHTPISPYLGVGFGVFFFGNRLEGKRDCNDTDGDGFDDDCDYSDPSMIGWEVFPAVGVEFLRHSSIRLHVDLRYLFDFAGEAHWGHGLAIMAGVNF